jgi:hypothetical protein
MNIGQQKTMLGIARHFGIPRKIIAPAVEASLCANDQVHFGLARLSEEGILCSDIANRAVFVSREPELRTEVLMNWARLYKTPLFASFMDAYQSWGDELLFTFVGRGDVWVIQASDEYSGYGGIYVRPIGKAGLDGTGVAIETLKNYLEFNYPKLEE